MEKITSKSNDLIKDVKKLISSSRKRREDGFFVLEGARLCFDILNSLYEAEIFLISESAYKKYGDTARELSESKALRTYIISDEVAEKLSDTDKTQGVFAVCRMKKPDYEIKSDDRIIILDNVQDPGNLGTVLRTAEALGISAVYVCGGCDVYNPKVIRATMGSLLRLPIFDNISCDEAVSFLHNLGMKVYATVPDDKAQDITKMNFEKGCACVIGNEANGVSPEIIDKCDGAVTIRMLGNAESLNASVAAAITMWEMLR